MEVARAETLLRTEEDLLKEASRVGVTKVTITCSLLGGYAEDDGRERWACVAMKGMQHAVSRGATRMDALIGALRNLGVVS